MFNVQSTVTVISGRASCSKPILYIEAMYLLFVFVSSCFFVAVFCFCCFLLALCLCLSVSLLVSLSFLFFPFFFLFSFSLLFFGRGGEGVGVGGRLTTTDSKSVLRHANGKSREGKY